ncbi:hypothetical protein [uncultured Eudoraea sp.]|uniref:hypothetical protein n=1 Tax=uncultured Eudoraea sp. TaxID=1035614 RepID=UPI00260611D3|nr:hypothetical protein [uncultured Eudoraea sp.]
MRILILGLLMLAGTCGSQKDKVKDINYQELGNNPLTLILSDNYGGAESEQLLVIRDNKALKRFFTKVNMTRKPGLQIPEIDFNTEMVVIYCNGKTTDMNTPILARMEDKDDKMIFARKPESNQKKGSSTAVLMPFYLYKMPLTEKEIMLSNN